MQHDFSQLPANAIVVLNQWRDQLDNIWAGWCDDLPARDFSKRSQFVASTIRTIQQSNRSISRKTAEMLTDYAIRYYLLPGKSDLVRGHPRGYYGWPNDL